MEATRLLKIGEVARRLACSVKALRKKIKAGEFPQGLKLVGRAQVWTETDVEMHLYQQLNAHRFIPGLDPDDLGDEDDDEEDDEPAPKPKK